MPLTMIFEALWKMLYIEIKQTYLDIHYYIVFDRCVSFKFVTSLSFLVSC
jgi:hypothetical protein